MLGGLQVAANGDLANYRLPGKVAESLGGAQDLATCARPVIVLMTHVDEYGRPKIVERTLMHLTAPRCVTRVITDIAVLDITPAGVALRDVLEGWTPDAVQEVTATTLVVDDVRQLEL